jgi:hypothetical protein
VKGAALTLALSLCILAACQKNPSAEKSLIRLIDLLKQENILKSPLSDKPSMDLTETLVKDFFKHKTFLKEITLSRNEWQDAALTVPPEDVGQEAILLLKVSRTWNPLKTTGVPDPRNLGVAVGKITFRDK